MALAKQKSIRDALDWVAAHPAELIKPINGEQPVWQIVASNLYKISIAGDVRVSGSVAQANRAAKIILNRTAGTRIAGTKPAQKTSTKVIMKDLTGGEVIDG